MTLAEGKTAGEDPNSHIERPAAPARPATSATTAAAAPAPAAPRPTFTLELEPTEEEKQDDPVLTQPPPQGAIPGTRGAVMPAKPASGKP